MSLPPLSRGKTIARTVLSPKHVPRRDMSRVLDAGRVARDRLVVNRPAAVRSATPGDACWLPVAKTGVVRAWGHKQLPSRRRAMSPLARSTNIAARMGRWSASHWKTAVFGWLAFVVAAIAVGMTVTTKQIDVADANVGQSHKADQILKSGFPQADPQTELVVVQSATKTVDSPAFRATVNDVVRSVKGDPATKNFKSPLTAGHATR